MPVMNEPALAEANKQSRADEFLGVSKARGWSLAQNIEHAGLIEHLAVLLGGEEARDQGVHADVLVRPLAGEVAGEVVDGGLGKRVGENARERIEAGNGAEVDDGGGAGFFDEITAEDLAGAENRGEIGIDDALVFLLGDVEKRGGGVGAGSVDEDVRLAGAVEHGIQQVLQRFAGCHIDGHEVSFSAVGFDFRQAFLGLFGDTAAEHDFGTGACQADGHRAAEFAGAADDDSGFAGEVEEVFEECGRLHGMES